MNPFVKLFETIKLTLCMDFGKRPIAPESIDPVSELFKENLPPEPTPRVVDNTPEVEPETPKPESAPTIADLLAGQKILIDENKILRERCARFMEMYRAADELYLHNKQIKLRLESAITGLQLWLRAETK